MEYYHQIKKEIIKKKQFSKVVVPVYRYHKIDSKIRECEKLWFNGTSGGTEKWVDGADAFMNKLHDRDHY